jgi:hypothetical protein
MFFFSDTATIIVFATTVSVAAVSPLTIAKAWLTVPQADDLPLVARAVTQTLFRTTRLR